MHDALQHFHPTIAKWFESRLGIPTPPQILGWPLIAQEKSALILAPTGSGKTLAAFLAAIDWLAKRLLAAEQSAQTVWGVQILYISPLKSLANDIQKNLLGPISEIADLAASTRQPWPEIHVGVRTGDTPQKARAAIARRPPHILITTPESLNLMLTSGQRNILASTRFVIVDEVHALAGSKRGVFTSLLLERLEHERTLPHDTRGNGRGGKLKIAPGVYVPTEPLKPLVRIGLSATARPEDLIAQWLAGNDDEGNPRPIEVVKSGQRKRLDLGVICPFGEDPSTQDSELRTQDSKPRGTGHWPEVTRAILQLIREHKSTLVFGNSRRLIERLAERFREELDNEQMAFEKLSIENRKSKFENQPVILPHHGSISKEVRLETEQALKRGEVDAVLATSSLELGIDIGSLDLVVQIDSPGNVAAALQRVGRAGHLEKATAKGRLVARGRFELASLAALVPLMYAGIVEETRLPENCLDVLAQQIVAACVPRPWKRGELFRIFRRATPLKHLAEKQFDSVVAMLSKRAQRVTSQGLRPRLSFDRVNDELIIMPGASKVVMVNSGVISDTGAFPVFLVGGKKGRVELGAKSEQAPREAAQAKSATGLRIGELDEEFVYETKEGDRIVLGSQTWRVVRIDADRVLVEHGAPGSSRMPFWRGEAAPRSDMLGDALCTFLREVETRLLNEDDEKTRAWLQETHKLDEQATENAITFYRRQMAAAAGRGLPTDQRIVIEHFHDRTGEPIIAILCPLGSRVNYTLRLALESHFARRKLPAQLVHNDDGIIIRPPHEIGEIPESPIAWLRAANLQYEIIDQLDGTALFGMRFRQNAARALMLPRMTVTQRTPLWQQRLRARHLLALVKKERNFPIIIETYREILQDVLHIGRVKELLSNIESGQIAVNIYHNPEPSPFAHSLFSQFQASYLYEWDDPLLQQEIEPAVDQTILDELLQRRTARDGAPVVEAAAAWTDADEESLRRRITGADYPARSPEELLEKIETTGAVGVPFGVPPLRGPGIEAVGGSEHLAQMLAELSQKSRLFLVSDRLIAVDNLAILLAASKKRPALHRLTGHPHQPTLPAYWPDIPPALLESDLSPAQAKRLIVEQAIKLQPTTTLTEIANTLPWLAKEIPSILAELLREGLVQQFVTPAQIENQKSKIENRLVWIEYAEQLRSLALRRERRAASTVDIAALQRHLLRWQHLDNPRDGGGGTDAIEDVLDLFTGLALPLSTWEHEILPTRVKDFSPALLDAICRTGHRVWVGSSKTSDDGNPTPADLEIAFYPRHLLPTRPPLPAATLSENAQKILVTLEKLGASFLLDLQLATKLDDPDTAVALQELILAGKISNDQLEGLREVQRLAANVKRDHSFQPHHSIANRYPAGLHRTKGQRHLPGGWWKQRSSLATPTGGGRWFILPEPQSAQSALDLTERAADRVDRLLRRTGFACRELIDAAIDGPWRNCYDVLTRMEWAGSVRRGYFVEGISGSQFMLPTVRLDSSQSPSVIWLSMLDPANVWAQVNTRFISDAGEPARISRSHGNWIALIDGTPVLAATNYGHRLIPLPAPWEHHERALQSIPMLLPRLPRDHRTHLDVRQWDQQDIIGSPADEILRRLGFTRDTQGLRLYRQYTKNSESRVQN